MADINFVLHADCDIPCLHIVMSENGEVVSDSEAYLPDYANIIPRQDLVEYSNALGAGFLNNVDIISASAYNINVFNGRMQDMIKISKKKTEVDAILNPPQTESENEIVEYIRTSSSRIAEPYWSDDQRI
jgi:hypothetical protein